MTEGNVEKVLRVTSVIEHMWQTAQIGWHASRGFMVVNVGQSLDKLPRGHCRATRHGRNNINIVQRGPQGRLFPCLPPQRRNGPVTLRAELTVVQRAFRSVLLEGFPGGFPSFLCSSQIFSLPFPLPSFLIHHNHHHKEQEHRLFSLPQHTVSSTPAPVKLPGPSSSLSPSHIVSRSQRFSTKSPLTVRDSQSSGIDPRPSRPILGQPQLKPHLSPRHTCSLVGTERHAGIYRELTSVCSLRP